MSELDELRLRVAQLERGTIMLRDKGDSIDTEAAATTLLVNEFLIPAILLLAGNGFRPQLREMLAETELRMRDLEPFHPLPLAIGQLQHWRRMLDEQAAWSGFPRYAHDAGGEDDAGGLGEE